MVRSSLKSVLSLCLIAAAGYGAYLPFEIIRSHQIEQAAKPAAVNAVLSELMSQADQDAAIAAQSVSRISKDGRINVDGVTINPDLIDKTL